MKEFEIEGDVSELEALLGHIEEVIAGPAMKALQKYADRRKASVVEKLANTEDSLDLLALSKEAHLLTHGPRLLETLGKEVARAVSVARESRDREDERVLRVRYGRLADSPYKL